MNFPWPFKSKSVGHYGKSEKGKKRFKRDGCLLAFTVGENTSTTNSIAKGSPVTGVSHFLFLLSGERSVPKHELTLLNHEWTVASPGKLDQGESS